MLPQTSENAQFLIMNHPFDVGDEISLKGFDEDQKYRVTKIMVRAAQLSQVKGPPGSQPGTCFKASENHACDQLRTRVTSLAHL